VQRRGPKAFHGLVTALAQSGNGRAAGILDPYSEPLQEGEPRSLGKVWNPPNYQEALVPPAAPYRPDSTTPLEVKVVRAAQGNGSTAKAAKCYRMMAKPRGLVLIIDNENFQHDVLSTRTGSLVDSNNLDILFGQLGFRVTLRRNLGYHEMIQEVQKFSGRTEEHEAADMAVLCILSHGRHGLVAAADGRELETEWVLRQINNDGCPALRGKPKLVILQACRGDEADYGVAPAVTFPEERTASDARMVEPPASQQYKQLSWEDMVVAYATLPGYVANRDRYRGTWFVESLCKVFMEMAADTDLRDMLDVVGEKLKGYESEMGTKQSFAYEVRHFYKKLFFNPE
jgi:caspase-like apoptosis-related cysteine protease